MSNLNNCLLVFIILLSILIYYYSKTENFSPYAQILIPKIYLSDAAHDNRNSCDVTRFDVSGVYNRTMLDTFNPCGPYDYWKPPRNIAHVGDSERTKMGLMYQNIKK